MGRRPGGPPPLRRLPPGPAGGYAALPTMYAGTGPVVGAERVPAGIPLTNPWARLGASLLDGLLIIVTLFIGWFERGR